MANGWARDGAVQDQIDDTVSDAVKIPRARLPAGDGGPVVAEENWVGEYGTGVNFEGQDRRAG